MGQIIDSITFPNQSTNVAYARIPNGTGPFVYNTPSFNYNNDFASIVNTNKLQFKCYPNPFQNRINIYLDNKKKSNVFIYDIHGKIIIEKIIEPGENKIVLNTSTLKNGMYLVLL